MNMMSTEEEKIVAVLHDVFEMCSGYALCRVADNSRFYIKIRLTLEEFDITYNVFWALMLLSKNKHISYDEYVLNIINKQLISWLKNIKTNKLATKVKLADIFHNMSCEPSEHAKQKYLKALPILLKGI